MLLKDLSAPPFGGPAARGERLAFWINTYNDVVSEGLAALGIQETVCEVPDFFDRIRVRVAGLDFSANDIEHGVLRGNRPHPLSPMAPFTRDDPRLAHALPDLDPRIHFAIICGARSCPPVRTYEGGCVHEQLGAATRTVLREDLTLDGVTLVASPAGSVPTSRSGPGGCRGSSPITSMTARCGAPSSRASLSA